MKYLFWNIENWIGCNPFLLLVSSVDILKMKDLNTCFLFVEMLHRFNMRTELINRKCWFFFSSSTAHLSKRREREKKKSMNAKQSMEFQTIVHFHFTSESIFFFQLKYFPFSSNDLCRISLCINVTKVMNWCPITEVDE